MVTIQTFSYGEDGEIKPEHLEGERDRVGPDKVQVPDLWHVAQYLGDHGFLESKAAVLNPWHLAIELLALVQNLEQASVEAEAAHTADLNDLRGLNN